MGRYYSGDIEGKFWFGVQASNDASFFGGIESEPNYLNYYFETSDLESIEKGIRKCIKKLGEYKDKLDKFFKDNNGYNDEMIVKELNVPLNKAKELLEWYARLGLGNEILECVKKEGKCEFEAEL
jgi:hypothetical protein